MKRVIFLLLLGFFIIIFQTSLLRYLGPFKPNLILILVIYVGIFYEYKRGAIISFILGYLVDIFSGNIAGLNTFINLTIFNLIVLMKEKIIFESSILEILLIIIMSLYNRAVTVLVLQILSPSQNLYPYINNLIPRILSNAIIGYLLLSLLKKIEGINEVKGRE
jgi:rod shape-determining protein MreD